MSRSVSTLAFQEGTLVLDCERGEPDLGGHSFPVGLWVDRSTSLVFQRKTANLPTPRGLAKFDSMVPHVRGQEEVEGALGRTHRRWGSVRSEVVSRALQRQGDALMLRLLVSPGERTSLSAPQEVDLARGKRC